MKAGAFGKLVATKCGHMTGASEDGQSVAFDPVTIVTLITTILPVVMGWVQQCKAKKQGQEVQPAVAADHNGPGQERQIQRLQVKILQECKSRARDERKRAKETGIPADVGRYAIDSESARKLAVHSIGTFVAMKPADAAELVAEGG